MLKFFGMYYEISDQQCTLVTARLGLYFYFMLKFAMILLLYFILYECFIFTLTWLCERFLHIFFCQVRTKLESLDGIVPPTNGFMISSTAMKNVWLSMEHQAILWCNQLVVQVGRMPFLNSNLIFLYMVLNVCVLIQVSHTILSLIDSRTGQPFPDTQKRLTIFTRMLRSGIPQSFNWMMQSHLASQEPKHVLVKDVKDAAGIVLHLS